MFEQNTYSHTSGKQQVRIPLKKPGNMYMFTVGGGKKKGRKERKVKNQ